MKNTIGKPSPEAGFTIVEVMAAMVILIIGVLSTFTLIEGSLASTSRTTAREQGTSLARDLVERSRQVAYDQVTSDLAATTLRTTLTDATGAPGSMFSVTRRGVAYKVTVSACSIDDPTDGVGEGDATFCLTPTGPPPNPGPPPPVPAGKVRLLGVDVALAGSLLDTVCNAIGDPEILTTLQQTLSPVATVGICTGGSGPRVQLDNHPDDLRRVRVDVKWTRGGAGNVSQTTLLTNPVQTS